VDTEDSVESIPFVDLRAQYQALREEILPAIEQVMATADFILGREVRAFEEEFTGYVGGLAGYGVASGTDALHLALRACGVGPGDEVILPTNTFIATALAVSLAGAKPVLVDIDPETHLLDLEQTAAAITRRTRAIIPVHLFGRAMDLAPLVELAERHGLEIVEDACQAHGARVNGARVGSIGALGTFSFYPGKNLGAYGDGGFIVINREDLVESVRMLRCYGEVRKYHHRIKGFNSRLDSIQAAVLRVKLRRLEEWNRRREALADMYRERLSGLPVKAPAPAAPGGHVYHLFVIEVERRDELREYLGARGIATGIHYPIPIHLQGAYRELGHERGRFPVAEEKARRLLSLPIFPEMTEAQVDRVCEAVAAFHGGGR
jgi:dTDP-4-amino-4,6-dideoxygalactose transaminase